jgi:hypothetical protein
MYNFPHTSQRPLSWSALSSFEYDPEQWFETYCLDKRQESKEMTFGSFVDKKIQEDKTFLPDLPRYPLEQYKMNVMLGKQPLVGLPDGLDLDKYLLADYKTGKKAWDKKRADDTGQLTFYLLLIYITHKIVPEKFRCFIHWLETCDKGDFTINFVDDMEVKTFETRRTMTDLLKFCVRINKTVKAMKQYCKTHA